MLGARSGEPSGLPLHGPSRIGQALIERGGGLNYDAIEQAFYKLRTAAERVHKPIKLAARENTITEEQKRAAIVGQRRIMDLLAAQSTLLSVLRENLNDAGKRGQRLQEAVEICIEAFETKDDPVTSPYDAMVALRARDLLNVILHELKRLAIADVCEQCGRVFYPASPRKRMCSSDFEGRDCNSRKRSSTYYYKNKTRLSHATGEKPSRKGRDSH